MKKWKYLMIRKILKKFGYTGNLTPKQKKAI